MQVDCQIFTEVDTLVVEYPYCSMYFDRKAIEDKAYQIFGDDYEHAVIYNRLKERKYLDFAFLDNDASDDTIHTSGNYHTLEAAKNSIYQKRNYIKTIEITDEL
jgi:hypothetical protein